MELTTYRWKGFKIRKIKNDDPGIYVETDLIKFIDKIDLKGKNVIDGGSNAGVFSLYLSRRVGKKGMVYAFEIQGKINNIAKDNACLNNKTNIIFHHQALSNKSGDKVGFTYIDYYGEKLSSVGVKTEPTLSGQEHCGEVETITIDDLGIENVGLIKLDLEGNEPEAIEGAMNTIINQRPFLIVELSPGYISDPSQTIEKIKSHNYSVTQLPDYNYCFEPL